MNSKNIYVPGIVFLVISVIIIAGCGKNPVDTAIDELDEVIDAVEEEIEIIEFIGTFNTWGFMEIQLNHKEAIITNVGVYDYWSYKVGDRFFAEMERIGPNQWEGLRMAGDGTYLPTKVTIGDFGLLAEDDEEDSIHKSWDKVKELEDETSGFEGGWRRYGNPNGYQTDLQIGGISGEPANRVYMCTLPPTPSPQLYKGTLQSDGATIVWDASHNVPNYVIQSTGATTMELFVPVLNAVGGSYVQGKWRSGSCGLSL